MNIVTPFIRFQQLVQILLFVNINLRLQIMIKSKISCMGKGFKKTRFFVGLLHFDKNSPPKKSL
jgi:hypothetical protein